MQHMGTEGFTGPLSNLLDTHVDWHALSSRKADSFEVTTQPDDFRKTWRAA